MWPLLLTLNLALAAFMTGLIWFVQVVHYPLFAAVGAEAFEAYERRHMRRTTWIVGPAMLLEAAVAVALVWLAEAAHDQRLAWVGVTLVAINWISTATLQGPDHRRLSRGFDAAIARRLVRTNWIRTVGWSARTVVGVWLMVI